MEYALIGLIGLLLVNIAMTFRLVRIKNEYRDRFYGISKKYNKLYNTYCVRDELGRFTKFKG